MLDEVTPLHSPQFRNRLLQLGNPQKMLQRMHELINDICMELTRRSTIFENSSDYIDQCSKIPELVKEDAIAGTQKSCGSDVVTADHSQRVS